MLPDPQIRQELSALSGWPTIPQVFIKGELVGGADIVEELYESGELQAKLDEALGTEREPRRDGSARMTLPDPVPPVPRPDPRPDPLPPRPRIPTPSA